MEASNLGDGQVGRWLYRPIDAATLACFRVAFGAILFIETVWHWRIVESFFVEPGFHFTYPLTPFARALPSPWMYVYMALIAAAAIGVALGLFYRLCAVALFVLYGHLFLIDQAYYNNHFYLCVLIAMWMAIAPAHRLWSLDVYLKRVTRWDAMPAWPIIVLRAQWVLVYVFGALAKLNGDWLRGEPMRAYLRAQPQWLHSDAAAMFFAWGGFVFDLLIGPALLWRKTRRFAIAAMLFFHTSNHFLFHIGIFPWFALASIVLFIEPSTPRRWIKSTSTAANNATFQPRRAMIAFIAIYMAVQLLAPLRMHLYPGQVSWAREGWYFAWTMKLEAKDCFVGMQVIDRRTGQAWEVDQSRDLNAFQRHRMWQDPGMIAQYARHVRRVALRSGVHDPLVIVDAVAALNGRPYQYMIDPHIALAETSPTWPRPEPWIVPLRADAPIGRYVWSQRQTREQVMAVIRAARSGPMKTASRDGR